MSRKQFSPDDPDRRRWQDPDGILAMIGLEGGMVFVDAGCGDGYFALPAARLVGGRGRVYAFDPDADAVGRLRRRAEQEGLGNLVATVREAETAVSQEGCADIVFFGIDLHDLRDPAVALANARLMLRDGGHLVDLDWKAESTPVGPPLEKRFAVGKARDLIISAGLRIVSVRDAGAWHYLITATRQ